MALASLLVLTFLLVPTSYKLRGCGWFVSSAFTEAQTFQALPQLQPTTALHPGPASTPSLPASAQPVSSRDSPTLHGEPHPTRGSDLAHPQDDSLLELIDDLLLLVDLITQSRQLFVVGLTVALQLHFQGLLCDRDETGQKGRKTNPGTWQHTPWNLSTSRKEAALF